MFTLSIKLVGIEEDLTLRSFTDENLIDFNHAVMNKGVYVHSYGDITYRIVCSKIAYYVTEPQIDGPAIDEYFYSN